MGRKWLGIKYYEKDIDLATWKFLGYQVGFQLWGKNIERVLYNPEIKKEVFRYIEKKKTL